MYIHATNILHNIGVDSTYPQGFLRVLVISELVHGSIPSLPIHNIYTKLRERSLQHYLYSYGIPHVDLSREPSLPAQVMEVRKLVPHVDSFRYFMSDAFPCTIKNDDMIQQLGRNPLSLYTCVYAMLAHCAVYVGKDVTNGSLVLKQVYEPRTDMWASVGVTDVAAFIKYWQSVSYYDCVEQHMYKPQVLKEAMTAYAKKNLPRSLLLSHYVQMATHHDEWDEMEIKSSLFNPWIACREAEELPQIEHGLTIEEALFNDSIVKLIQSNVSATDIVNGLFYANRRDTLVEKNILFPIVQLEVSSVQRVLVVNPSPDFLVEFSKSPATENKRTTFVVTDETIAQAYAIQFYKHRAYNFVSFEEFEFYEHLPNNHENLLPDYDYIVVMARDASLKLFSKTLRWCSDKARLVLFLPQTMMTSKSEENIITEFEDNLLRVDSILELPSALSESGKRKKMILRAHVAEEIPSHFALISTEYHTPDLHAQNQPQKGSKKRSKQKDFKVTHYAVPDRLALRIPYSVLGEHCTIKQMRNRHEHSLQPAHGSDEAKKHYSGGKTFDFSQDIGITMNLYQQPDGRYVVRAYRQFVSVQYGRSKRQRRGSRKSKDNASRKLTRTKYYETGPCTLAEIYTRINEWALRPNIMEQIVQDMEAHYADCPEKLTLKSVWYCIRADLISTYMTYDDDLAVQLFCCENKELSDLPLRDIDEEKIFAALRLTVSDRDEDPRYRRLLDLIFRMAVRRGFLDTHPFIPTKTSYDHECQRAMRQLRQALGKDSLSLPQIRKVLAFLFEPVDEQQTPRCIKESCWLVPLVRLCTGMPLREICALTVKDFREIEDLGIYQFYVTKLANDSNKIVPITNYQFVRQYRKVPCCTLLRDALLQRLQYMEKVYGISLDDAKLLPLFLAEEPGAKHAGRKAAAVQCTIQRARKISSIALSKAEIPSDVITLLDGDAAFEEDLNTCRNDLFHSNFSHYANTVCGMTAGQRDFIVAHAAPNCYSRHYVDYQNAFLQLDMIQRLDRLFALVQADADPAEYIYTTRREKADHVITAFPHNDALASMEVTIIPTGSFSAGSIHVSMECQSGAEYKIITYTKEIHT